VSGTAIWVFLFVRWLQDLEGTHEGLIDGHHGSGVVEFAAVVRGGEQRDELALRKELIAILDHLMSSADEVKVVLVQELRDNLRPECE